MNTIILQGPKKTGKTTTLRIFSDQFQNIYRSKTLAETGDDKSADFSALQVSGEKLIFITTNPALFKTLSEKDKISLLVFESDVTPVSGFEENTTAVTKSIRDNEKAFVLANIRDCDKMLEIAEKFFS